MARSRVALVGLLLLGACQTVPDEPPVVLEIVGYGIIQSERVVMRKDETSSVGAELAAAQRMRVVTQTTRVPLRRGLSYGIAFRVIEAPSQEVAIRVVLRTTATCVLKESGRVVHHNDSLLTVRVGELRHVAARIPASDSENHCAGEPQPGSDTFELYFDQQKLASKSFDVYLE